jgi:hypothetical protein
MNDKQKKMRHVLNLQMFAGEKTKLEKHIEELEEMTSGNSKDSVTFVGRGLELLKSIIGINAPLAKKKGRDASDVTEEEDEDPEDPADTNEDQDEAKNAGKMKKSANGGEIEEADDDPEDPAQAGDDAKGGSIITNKGKKIAKAGSAAVKKSIEFDEELFQKSFVETYADAIDASEALADLAKSFVEIGNAGNESRSLIKSVIKQNTVIANVIAELLKSQASLSAEMELIKKQPVDAPQQGFVIMSKKLDSKNAPIKLNKSDIQDTLTDLMNDGLDGANMLLKKLGVIHNQADLSDFIDNLPDEIREKI